MVKPGGTGRPRDDISARFAPLPPRRFFIEASPSADPPPKPYTHLVMSQFLNRGLTAGPSPAYVEVCAGPVVSPALRTPSLARCTCEGEAGEATIRERMFRPAGQPKLMHWRKRPRPPI